LELIRREIILRATGCACWLFSGIKIRIQERLLIGLKHINLKELLMPFVSSLEKTNYGFKTKLSENKKYWLIQTLCIYITTFSVLQSTISIPQLVKRLQRKMPAVAMTDHANLMGAFHFVRDILNHNKAAEANAALIENGENLRRFL
jgi:DNA polymerase-3 subunit alpha